jgi:hypothetical protein
MKKVTVIVLALVLFIGNAIAQEEAQTQTGPAPQRQMPAPAYLRLGFGDLYFSGEVYTGVRARAVMQDEYPAQRGQASGELGAVPGKWVVGALNPVWAENRADLSFRYTLGNFGAFVMLRAQGWTENTLDWVGARYAHIYNTWLDGKVKFSIGKLYDQVMTHMMLGEGAVWTTDGSGNTHRFTNEDRFSARLELKPADGLSFGAQYFLVDTRDYIGDEAWKEIGIAATYNHSLFGIQAGARFDSSADGLIAQEDSRTYNGWDRYYGSGNRFGLYMEDAIDVLGDQTYWMPISLGGPDYKHKADVEKQTIDDTTGKVTVDRPAFDGAHYAFFGFQFKGIRNLTARVHGGLYNLGDFDRFGYGRIMEDVAYDGLIPNLKVGLIASQEFLGNDVFDTATYNVSPFFKFTPFASYGFLPGTNGRNQMTASLQGEYGICVDVLETWIRVRPGMEFRLGTYALELYYEMTYEDYVDAKHSAGWEPISTHIIGLAGSIMY